MNWTKLQFNFFSFTATHWFFEKQSGALRVKTFEEFVIMLNSIYNELIFFSNNNFLKAWKLTWQLIFINAQERFSYKYFLVIDFDTQAFGEFEKIRERTWGTSKWFQKQQGGRWNHIFLLWNSFFLLFIYVFMSIV